MHQMLKTLGPDEVAALADFEMEHGKERTLAIALCKDGRPLEIYYTAAEANQALEEVADAFDAETVIRYTLAPVEIAKLAGALGSAADKLMGGLSNFADTEGGATCQL